MFMFHSWIDFSSSRSRGNFDSQENRKNKCVCDMNCIHKRYSISLRISMDFECRRMCIASNSFLLNRSIEPKIKDSTRLITHMHTIQMNFSQMNSTQIHSMFQWFLLLVLLVVVVECFCRRCCCLCFTYLGIRTKANWYQENRILSVYGLFPIGFHHRYCLLRCPRTIFRIV